MAKNFTVEYLDEPRRNQKFRVRGICEYDVLNPCFDNRPNDIPGQHWGGGAACEPCSRTALAKAEG